MQPPPILNRDRRFWFARLIANGAVQAAAAIALPFAVLSIGPGGLGEAWPGVLGLLALAALALGLRVVELADAERLGLDYVAEVRMALFDGLTDSSARGGRGVAMSRMLNDLSALKNWAGFGLARSFSAGLAFLGCLIAAAMFSWTHAVAILAPATAILAIGALLSTPLRARVAAVRSARGRLANLLGEALLSRELLQSYGQMSRVRRRVRRAGRALNAEAARRIRVAAALRAAPDALMPLAIATAIVLGAPLRAESVGLMLLAGLAAGPLRQALRAIEYRTAFLIARERLAPGLRRRRKAAPAPRPSDVEPGLTLLRGPLEHGWRDACRRASLVTSQAEVLPRSLRRNIDLTRALDETPERLAEITAFCGLDDVDLGAKLDPEDARFTEARRARLSLARALAAGSAELAVNAPALVIEAEGRALLQALPERFRVRVTVWIGDAAPF